MSSAAPSPASAPLSINAKQSLASGWFRELRDSICASFEAIEDELASGPHAALDAGRFERKMWDRDTIGSEGNESASADGVFSREASVPSRKTAVQRGDEHNKGGGEISIMRGRVFEKVGVNISTVSGKFSEKFQKEMPGGSDTPYYWASGISLVAHMRSPLVPAAHMNTRMICLGDRDWGLNNTEAQNRGQACPAKLEERRRKAESRKPNPQGATRLWFGGGGDLNPMYDIAQDTADFHGAFQKVCDAYDPDWHALFKAWCDEYFFIPHRNEARGVGGIFYDYLGFNSQNADAPLREEARSADDAIQKATRSDWTASPKGSQNGSSNFGGNNHSRGPATQAGMEATMAAPQDWDTRFAFTKQVGETFRDIYGELIRRHIHEPWTDKQREWQLEKRGRYAEYNLLYDRGTRFGLMTGGNPEAILMSLPPEARWP